MPISWTHFFDGGGDVNLSLVAAAIVARWAWPYVMTQGVNDVREVRLHDKNTETKNKQHEVNNLLKFVLMDRCFCQQ